MPDLGRSGIEYPNLIFQGPVSLERPTTHEVAHQWFYSLVGNDQARDPWLDEGLANWAAMSIDHFESILSLPIPAAAQGRLGAPVSYWEQHPTD
jgi:aminopeptidase N